MLQSLPAYPGYSLGMDLSLFLAVIPIRKSSPMETFKKSLKAELKKHKISQCYSDTVDGLFKQGILKENMPYRALLNTFLITMSKSERVFEEILKNRYAFDLTCTIVSNDVLASHTDAQIASKIKRSFMSRLDYVHVERREAEIFLGLKFSKTIYSELKGSEFEPYLYPYKLLLFDESIKITDYRFDQILLPYQKPPNIQIKYAEFVEHLKSLKLPLSVVGEDILFENTNILPTFDVFVYLEASSQWPKDAEAVDCAKTAFYCQLYLKSKYRHAISRDWCVFKYKDLYFKIKILIKSDFTPRYNVMLALQSTVKKQGEGFYRKVHMAKMLFSKIGLYPLHLDDYLVDLVCLMVAGGAVGDAKFMENLLGFAFDFYDASFDLETLKLSKGTKSSNVLRVQYKNDTFNLTLPPREVIDELKAALRSVPTPVHLFNDELDLVTGDLFELDVSEYDVLLTRDSIPGCSEILGNITDSFDLGTPDIKEFTSSALFKMGNFYYNPLKSMLLANVKAEIDTDLFANLLILETSFGYMRTKA